MKKLEEIYEILTKALSGIEDVGELSDYDLDNAVDEAYKMIADAQIYIYGLIKKIGE